MENGIFDIKNPDTFLGGQNVHNLIIIGMLGFLVYKSVKGQYFMWLDDYQHIEEAPQVTNITLDERFTESARLSVQGGLKSNFIGDSENQSSAIVVSAVAGVGIGLYFEKSPVLFGIIGSVIGTLLTRISK